MPYVKPKELMRDYCRETFQIISDIIFWNQFDCTLNDENMNEVLVVMLSLSIIWVSGVIKQVKSLGTKIGHEINKILRATGIVYA
jgi:hypothetical protein